VLAPGGVAYVYGPNRFSPHWFKSDPHYGLAVASALPNALGRRYVEWRRGKKGYDVGVFPVGNHVANVLSRAGLAVVDSPVHRARREAERRWGSRAQRIAPLVRAWGRGEAADRRAVHPRRREASRMTGNEDAERAFVAYWEAHLADPAGPAARPLARARTHAGPARARDRYRRDIERHVSLDGAAVLDVGCQCGALAVALCEAGAKVTGLDVDEPLLEGGEGARDGVRRRCDVREGRGRTAPVRGRRVRPRDAGRRGRTRRRHRENAEQNARGCCVAAGTLYLQGPNRLSPKWFWSDPHYQMFAISVLPPSVGRFYVTRVRGAAAVRRRGVSDRAERRALAARAGARCAHGAGDARWARARSMGALVRAHDGLDVHPRGHASVSSTLTGR
jgi:hypothetical protein